MVVVGLVEEDVFAVGDGGGGGRRRGHRLAVGGDAVFRQQALPEFQADLVAALADLLCCSWREFTLVSFKQKFGEEGGTEERTGTHQSDDFSHLMEVDCSCCVPLRVGDSQASLLQEARRLSFRKRDEFVRPLVRRSSASDRRARKEIEEKPVRASLEMSA